MNEMSKEYLDYIKSSRWKAICARYWLINGKKCQACGARDKLHVHHCSYDRFGREPMADLKGLCQECHRAVHAQHRRDRSVSLRLVTERYVAGKRKK